MQKLIATVVVFAFNTSQVLANCPSGQNLGHMNNPTIQSVLGGKYACVGTPLQNNELHTGSTTATSGQVLDYKKGPSDPNDPSDTPAHPTGTYSISGEVITYTYGSLTFSYNINQTPSGSVYTFCRVTPSGADLLVTVQATHC